MYSRIVVMEYSGVGNKEFLEDEEGVKRELRVALEEAGAVVYDVYGRKLGPGVTALAIIGDGRNNFRGRSHAAVHTYPERAYLRLTLDCYSHMDPDRAKARFSEILQPSQEPKMGELRLALEEL